MSRDVTSCRVMVISVCLILGNETKGQRFRFRFWQSELSEPIVRAQPDPEIVIFHLIAIPVLRDGIWEQALLQHERFAVVLRATGPGGPLIDAARDNSFIAMAYYGKNGRAAFMPFCDGRQGRYKAEMAQAFELAPPPSHA